MIIRIKTDDPVSPLRKLLCGLFGHKIKIVHDCTGQGPSAYKECDRCELQVDSWGIESTKAERQARAQLSAI